MPTYTYKCSDCGPFETYCSIKDYSPVNPCPKCTKSSDRDMVGDCKKIQFLYTEVQSPEFNPGLGEVVKNRQHRKELCKIKGMVEIGNESPSKIRKEYKKDREKKRQREWEKL